MLRIFIVGIIEIMRLLLSVPFAQVLFHLCLCTNAPVNVSPDYPQHGEGCGFGGD